MVNPIRLSYIAQCLDADPKIFNYYLAIEGDEYIISDEETEEDVADLEWKSPKFAELLRSHKASMLKLPSKSSVRDQHTMQKFVASVAQQRFSEAVQERLEDAIKGRGASKRFAEVISRFHLEEHWIRFRKRALRETAERWCQKNGVNYIDD